MAEVTINEIWVSRFLDKSMLRSIGQFVDRCIDRMKLLLLSDLGDQPCTGNTDQGDGKVGKHAYDSLNNDSIHSSLPSPLNARTAK